MNDMEWGVRAKGYLDLVFPVCRKVTVQYIGIIVFAVCGGPEPPLSFGEKPVGPYYSGHPRP